MLKPHTKIKIQSLIEDLFELLDTIEKQQILNELEVHIEANNTQGLKKLSREDIVNEIALQINRGTITK